MPIRYFMKFLLGLSCLGLPALSLYGEVGPQALGIGPQTVHQVDDALNNDVQATSSNHPAMPIMYAPGGASR